MFFFQISFRFIPSSTVFAFKFPSAVSRITALSALLLQWLLSPTRELNKKDTLKALPRQFSEEKLAVGRSVIGSAQLLFLLL